MTYVGRGCGSHYGVAVVCGAVSAPVAVVCIVAGRVAMARMRFVSGESFYMYIM